MRVNAMNSVNVRHFGNLLAVIFMLMLNPAIHVLRSGRISDFLDFRTVL